MGRGRTSAVQPPAKKQKRFVVKKGSVALKVYPTPPGWTVTWVSPDGRERKWFANETKARRFAGNKGDQLRKGQTKSISHEDMSSLLRARQLLRPWKVSVEFAAAEYARAMKVLAGSSLSEAIDFWAARRARKSVTIAAAVDEFLASKTQDKTGDRHAEDMRSRLGRFAAENAGMLDKVTPERLDAWLRGLRKIERSGDGVKLGGAIEGQTRNHYRAALLNFIGYARRKRWLSFLPEEFAAFAPLCVERGEVGIFAPSDVGKLLISSPDDLRPALVLGFFSGLRPSEVLRVEWSDIDLAAGHVFVRGKVRTARHRIAPVPPNGVAWLRPVASEGKVCAYAHPGISGKDLAEREGLVWIHDGPRHSFVSYRLAILGDFAKVSEETGTSVKTLRQHYRRPVPKAVAEEYFGIVPVSGSRQSENGAKP